MSRRLGKSTELYDDASVCEVIRSELTKPSLSSWINGQVIVSCLRHYRDWKAHVQTNSPVTFEAFLHCVIAFLFSLLLVVLNFPASNLSPIKEGGLLLDKTANHFFLFCKRRGRRL
jgi:hypothetical protein